MINILIKHFKGVVLLLLFFSPSVFAQNKPVITDSIKVAFLPALSYKSDLGLAFGGLYYRYHYKKDVKPYYSFYRAGALFSTKGLATAIVEYDKPKILDSDIRVNNQFYISRFLQDNYYGIGNYQKISDSFTTSQELYSFQSFSLGLDSRFRIPLHSSGRSSFDILGILNLDYQTPVDNGSERLITQEQPLGIDGGRTLHIGTGFIWENRDSEARPSKGNYLESSIEIGQTWFGSSYDTFVFKAVAMKYISFFLIKDITWANRISMKNTGGDVPYWSLAYAGDDETIRGYPLYRFLDDNSLILNTELRTWLFNIDAIEAEFGGTLFFDIGRTYPNGESVYSIFDDLKYSGGFGGTSSFITPDFIFRTDVAFSEEGMGIYFTAGYTF